VHERHDNRDHGGDPQKHEQAAPTAVFPWKEQVQKYPGECGRKTKVAVSFAMNHESFARNSVGGNVPVAMHHAVRLGIVEGVESLVNQHLAGAFGDHPEANDHANDSGTESQGMSPQETRDESQDFTNP